MKTIKVLLSLFSFTLGSCMFSADDKNDSEYLIRQNDISTTLSEHQEASFDALNTLQVSTDKRNRLFSTFSGAQQACLDPDTTLTISQAQLLDAMIDFVTKNCKEMKEDMRIELAQKAVAAQTEYKLNLCLDSYKPNENENNLIQAGTWVLPNVLGRRDVVMVW